MQNKFGFDPMDQYSMPVSSRKTKLSMVFKMKVREKPEKPGRVVAVTWDFRKPIISGFENNYAYTVTFAGEGKLAGNHYHEEKAELYFPLEGDFIVILEDPNTKTREELELKTADHEVIYIPKNIAHVVISKTKTATLLITATYPNIEEDEFPYKII